MSQERIAVAVAYHSGQGHTARVAEAVVRGAAAVPGTEVSLHDVARIDDALWAALARADAIVFGAPTYMGSPSAGFKAFAEATSKVWGNGMGWKNKIAAGFTNSGSISGDKLNSLVDLAVLAAQHGMLWVGLDLYPGWASSTGSAEDLNRLGSWLGVMTQSHVDQGPEQAPPASDLATAEHLGRRVATLTHHWARGRAGQLTAA
jgi:NAD(P)H dehydrogenase (quinone)